MKTLKEMRIEKIKEAASIEIRISLSRIEYAKYSFENGSTTALMAKRIYSANMERVSFYLHILNKIDCMLSSDDSLIIRRDDFIRFFQL